MRANLRKIDIWRVPDFPSFSEGLSLRAATRCRRPPARGGFPFLFGGTFIEGHQNFRSGRLSRGFPFLFGGTFIEGDYNVATLELI